MNHRPPRTVPRAYAKQIAAMVGRAFQWTAEHTDSDAQVRWNFTPEMAVIGTIRAGLASGHVIANKAGLELLEAMHGPEGEEEPTIFMARTAMDILSDMPAPVPRNPITEKIRRMNREQLDEVLNALYRKILTSDPKMARLIAPLLFEDDIDLEENCPCCILRTAIWENVKNGNLTEAEIDDALQ